MNLPSIESYATSGRSGNPLANAHAVVIVSPNGDTLKVWYSYRTCIAFALNGARTVHANDWSLTTGKHLAAIDGGDKQAKAKRVDADKFALELSQALAKFGRDEARERLADFGAEVQS